LNRLIGRNEGARFSGRDADGELLLIIHLPITTFAIIPTTKNATKEAIATKSRFIDRVSRLAIDHTLKSFA
jgi:hypothetical protein